MDTQLHDPGAPSTLDDRLLTIDEVSDLTRLPVATLRHHRHLHTGPRSFRLGRRVLYRSSDVHAWIAEHYDED